MKNYVKIPASHWAWGPSARWQLYFSLKKVGKRFSSYIVSGYSRGESSVITGSKCTTSLPVTVRKRHKSTKSCFRCDSRSSLNASLYQDVINKEDANKLIWTNENTVSIDKNNVLKCESNQLPSNHPNEDQIFITESPYEDGMIFGVLDGHGGYRFSEYAKLKLPYYLHSALANKLKLQDCQIEDIVKSMLNNDLSSDDPNWSYFLKDFINELTSNMKADQPNSMFSFMPNSLQQFLSSDFSTEALSMENVDIMGAIKQAFMQFDIDAIKDIKSFAFANKMNKKNTDLALSGCCGLVAYLNGDELYIANTGDCRAVLGSNTNGEWSALPLSQDHTSANASEVQRILSEHPSETCMQYGRLLGRLAPLRAFGDLQFKLTPEETKKILHKDPKFKPMPNVKTPPYLTAEPEVFCYKLEPNDQFIVLASDGLWDMLSNEDVVNLVGAYMEGKAVSVLRERAQMFGVPNYEEIMADPNSFMDCSNENAASFLIRFALGGYDEMNLLSMLSLPYPEVRFYRDDISIIVIYLKRNPDGDSLTL